MHITPGAVAGLRVIDLTTVIMGPFATATLPDLGAEVIYPEAEIAALAESGVVKARPTVTSMAAG
ncbi:CoA transferase [Mycobacterium sp. NPDC003449]